MKSIIDTVAVIRVSSFDYYEIGPGRFDSNITGEHLFCMMLVEGFHPSRTKRPLMIPLRKGPGDSKKLSRTKPRKRKIGVVFQYKNVMLREGDNHIIFGHIPLKVEYLMECFY